MSIPPLTRTSEAFRYHDRVVGDVWLRRSQTTTAEPEGPGVFTQRPAWINAWTLAIASAQATVHLASPTLTNVALLDALADAAKQRKVRVYIITGEGNAPELAPDAKRAHRAALDRLASAGATLQSSETFHPVLCLTDAAGGSTRAFLESDEHLCVDEPTLAPRLQRLFALGWWRHCVNRLSRAGAGKAEQPAAFPAQRVIPLVPVDVRPIAKPPAKPVQRLETADARQAFVTAAQARLWIAIDALDGQPALLEEAMKKAASCDVRMLLTNRPTQVDALKKLLAAGVKVRVAAGSPCVIADDRAWLAAGRRHGREPVNGLACAAILEGVAGAELIARFGRRWEQAELELRPQAKLADIASDYLPVAAPAQATFLPKPAPKKHVVLETPWTATSAADLTDSATHREAKDDPACNALELTYEWQVIAPKLPADAKEEFKTGPDGSKQPYSPRRFTRGKETYVLIDRTDPVRLSEFRALERQTKVRSVVPRE